MYWTCNTGIRQTARHTTHDTKNVAKLHVASGEWYSTDFSLKILGFELIDIRTSTFSKGFALVSFFNIFTNPNHNCAVKINHSTTTQNHSSIMCVKYFILPIPQFTFNQHGLSFLFLFITRLFTVVDACKGGSGWKWWWILDTISSFILAFSTSQRLSITKEQYHSSSLSIYSVCKQRIFRTMYLRLCAYSLEHDC